MNFYALISLLTLHKIFNIYFYFLLCFYYILREPFSSPFPFQEGEWESGCAGAYLPIRVNPPQLYKRDVDEWGRISRVSRRCWELAAEANAPMASGSLKHWMNPGCLRALPHLRDSYWHALGKSCRTLRWCRAHLGLDVSSLWVHLEQNWVARLLQEEPIS